MQDRFYQRIFRYRRRHRRNACGDVFGYDIKYVIGVSTIQMIFSLIFGSFVNFKNKILDVAPALGAF